MKATRLLMGMPITIEIVDKHASKKDIDTVFDYFLLIDNRFSTYKKNSEISQMNAGLISLQRSSPEMREVFTLSQMTKQETSGYFDIFHDGLYDPSGLVKGWAIEHAARMLEKKGYRNFFVDGGGDIQVRGKNEKKALWRVGIKNPFNQEELVKVLVLTNCGIATSGSYIRGNHIYNPKKNEDITDIVSLTVIAKSIYDADRICTGSFAMGKKGIAFIESLNGHEGYMITRSGIGIETTGFSKYVLH